MQHIPGNELLIAALTGFAGYIRYTRILMRVSHDWRRAIEVLITLVLSAIGVCLVTTAMGAWAAENAVNLVVQWFATSVPIGVVFGIKRREERQRG